MEIEQLIIPPKTISLLTTYQCTASCKNCCFGCNPQIKERLSLDNIKKYIDQAIEAFKDDLMVLVLTGGECFLLGDDLVKAVRYGASNNLIVRVVTNGYWAKTYQEAYNLLSNLRNNGLKEINFSTGDDHQEWVPYENIINGSMASMDLGLTCIINVEAHDNSKFNHYTFLKDHRLLQYFDHTKYKTPLRIDRGVWIPFEENSNLSYNSVNLTEKSIKQRCTSLFNVLAINPYSQMFACCGLTCEHIMPLRLGDVNTNNIKELYETQFLDFLKIWIYVEGPYSVLEYIYKKREIKKNVAGHICYMCAEIFKDEENITYIKDHYQEIMPSVMFKYFLLKTTY